MSKVSIIYWSQTGNTEAMAKAVAEGVAKGGCTAELLTVGNASAEELKESKVFALGCPAMGAEELEEAEMQPFVDSIEGSVAGKEILLFGSYGWGEGEWMRNWEERMKKAGANLAGGEGIICASEPDEDTLNKCRKAGEALAKLA